MKVARERKSPYTLTRQASDIRVMIHSLGAELKAYGPKVLVLGSILELYKARGWLTRKGLIWIASHDICEAVCVSLMQL